MEGVHPSDATTNMGCITRAIFALAMNIRHIVWVDPHVITRAVLARIGTEELVFFLVTNAIRNVARPVFGSRGGGSTNAVIFNGLKSITVTIGSGRIGWQDLIGRIVAAFCFAAVVLFHVFRAWAAFVSHVFAPDRNTGAH